MSELLGILRGKKIYSDNPKLTQLLSEVEYVPVHGSIYGGMKETRCDYCGRTNEKGKACESCGAPL